MKKKITKTMLMLIMSALCFLSQSTSSLAYKESEYEVDEEGFFYLNNADGPNKVPVTMFLLVQDDYVDTDFRISYEFWCTEGVFEYDEYSDDYVEYEGGLRFSIRSLNANNYYYRTVEGLGEVWLIKFTIEPGTYKFSYPNGMNYVTVLPSTLGSPLYDDGYKEAELRVVEAEDEVLLYGLLGDDDWRAESAPLEYITDFAKGVENTLLPPGSTAEETTETVQVENEPIESEKDPEEDSALSEAEALDTADNEEVQPTEDADAPEKENGVAKFVISGIVLVAVTVLLFALKKKDEDRSDN